MATIYDVAKDANVSISTVSRVLNSPECVAPTTRERVEAVLNKYNYVPNNAAKALVNKSAKTIGVLLPDIKNQHFSNAAYYLETRFFELGYSTLLCNCGNDSNIAKKEAAIKLLAGERVDALIMLGSVFSNPEVEKLVASYTPDIPVISSNAHLSALNCTSIEVDYVAGMELAITHLLNRGFEDIYFVQGNATKNTMRKADAFQYIIKKKGLPYSPKSHILSTNGYGLEHGREFAQNNMTDRKGRSAYIFMNDYTAIGAVNQLVKDGVAIPEEVGIIGHDNLDYGLYCKPELTTIDTKIEDIAKIIVLTVQNIFNGNTVGDRISIKPELIVRKTT